MSKVVVLGGGESGVGAAVLAIVKGHETFLSDCNMLQDDAKAMLERFNIPYEEGGTQERGSLTPMRLSKVREFLIRYQLWTRFSLLEFL